MEKFMYFLCSVEGIGRKKLKKMLLLKRTPKAIYDMRREEIEKSNVLNKTDIENFLTKREKWDVELEYEKKMGSDIKFYSLLHPDYPKRLKEIPDSPVALYVQGYLPNENKKTVAIIGARNCSEYGRSVATQLGKRLGELGIQVVSGLARGIDGIAQESAWFAGGDVFAVMGCGVDICYPRENRKLYDRLKERGGVISEHDIGVEPKPYFFPERNRIISGLADVVLVVEAREKSGTLITVDMALEQGKEVYVIPGRVTDPLSVGCNQLIAQGANIFVSISGFVDGLKNNMEYRMESNNKIEETDFDFQKIRNTINGIEDQEECDKELMKYIVSVVDIQGASFQKIFRKVSEKQKIEVFQLAKILFFMEEIYILHKRFDLYTIMW